MLENEFVRVYKCLGDPARQRIVVLLLDGPLCVCHIQKILGEPQPKVSRHLNLMKRHGLLTSAQEFNWRMYSICPEPSPVFRSALQSLREARDQIPAFRRDQANRPKVVAEIQKTKGCCPSVVARPNGSRKSPACGPASPNSISLPLGRKQTTTKHKPTC